MLRFRLGSSLLERYLEEGMAYLPDFVIYDLDESEYQLFWSKIKEHSQSRLYTDGVQVYRVGWIQYLFQSFKGWLGFDNHCQANKVELILAKVAYHGYLKGFKSKDFDNFTPSLISDRYRELINSKRENKNSAELQRLLVTYYLTHSARFPKLYQPVQQAYHFGRTLIREKLYNLVPSIDPQNVQIISEAITGMQGHSESPNPTDYFALSSFAEAYAEYLVGQDKYDEALCWSQQVKTKYKELFINFYIAQVELDDTAAKKAIELIVALSESPNTNDQSKAIDFVKNNFHMDDQLQYLESYPKLKNKIASSYLNDAIAAKNRNTFVKLLLGAKVIQLLAKAVRLNPHILDQDTSMRDVIMKEEWKTYLFNEAIKDKRFAEALSIYDKHPEFKFDKTKLSTLRDYCNIEINNKAVAMNNALVGEKERLL
jgi:hypothetical protein